MTAAIDDDRFLALLEAHKRILYKVANAYCRERDDRPDLIQEMAIELWRSFDRYDPRQAFPTWMYRVAMNVAISFYRRSERRTRGHVSIDAIDDALVDLGAADRMLDSAGDDLRELYRLIARLDPLDKALMILVLDGYGHEEIAAIAGLTPTNVATRISRIKQRMREELGS